MIRFARVVILIPALLYFAPDSHAQSTAGWALTEIRRDTSRLEKRNPPGKIEAISDTSAKVLLRLGPMNGNYAAIASAHKWSPLRLFRMVIDSLTKLSQFEIAG